MVEYIITYFTVSQCTSENRLSNFEVIFIYLISYFFLFFGLVLLSGENMLLRPAIFIHFMSFFLRILQKW